MTGSSGRRGAEAAETGCGRTTIRLLSSGLTVTMRSVMAVDGATITSERRAARCTTTALRRTEARYVWVEPGLLTLGEEVQSDCAAGSTAARRG